MSEEIFSQLIRNQWGIYEIGGTANGLGTNMPTVKKHPLQFSSVGIEQ
jgi:hypothetical protein